MKANFPRPPQPEIPKLNPWTSIWFAPRAAIRSVVEHQPKRHILLIAMLVAGTQAVVEYSGLPFSANLLLTPVVFLAGAFLGLIALFVFGALLKTVSAWLGGSADHPQIRAAVAWGSLPNLAIFFLWLCLAVTASLSSASLIVLLLIIFTVASLAFTLWALILTSKTLGEVNQYSAWKGFGSLVLSTLFIVIFVAVIAIALTAAFPKFIEQGSRQFKTAISPTEVTVTESGSNVKVEYSELAESRTPVVVRLKDGRAIDGRVVDEQGAYLYMDTASGVVNVEKREIVEIQKK